ncbi:MAG: ectoine/hydroxyectoine ABC transporter permease subunit EhuC [Rhodospirillales bacterium]|nr:ectoine/hydroxyectoine ABC transporter permease subunit EhuC [Rhodospirillales bacterium]
MIFDYLIPFGRGLLVTVEITVLSTILAAVIAVIAGLARLSKHAWVRWPAAVYVEFFRSTSCYVQLFWLFFALPFFGIYLDAFLVGIVGIALNIGSFASEVVRAAVLSVSKGQREAAIALNYTAWQRMRRVILPQAMIAMLPPMSNLMIELIKTTPLVSLITISDLTFTAHLFRTQSGQTFQAFGSILIIYFILSSGMAWIFNTLERRFRKGLAITARNL